MRTQFKTRVHLPPALIAYVNIGPLNGFCMSNVDPSEDTPITSDSAKQKSAAMAAKWRPLVAALMIVALLVRIAAAILVERHVDAAGRDFLVEGEGELTMVDVCENLEKGTMPDALAGIPGVIYRDSLGMVVTNSKRAFFKELDEFAPIDYSKVDVYKYKIPTLPGPPVVGLMITRGCPFTCTYCDAPVTTGKKIRYHSPERAVSDIVRMHKQFGVRGFSFRDSTFTAKKRWVREFCERLIEANVDVEWRCNTRVDCVTEDLLALMKKAGCLTINLGVESLHPDIMARINKDVPFEQIEDAH